MKKLVAALLLAMAVTVLAHVANAKTAIITLSEPVPVGERVCVFADTDADIAGRWTAGTLTTLTGQCSTEAGQTDISIENIVPGQTWYFSGVSEDALSNRSPFLPEVMVEVPVSPIQVQNLPPIEINGRTFTIQVVVE